MRRLLLLQGVSNCSQAAASGKIFFRCFSVIISVSHGLAVGMIKVRYKKVRGGKERDPSTARIQQKLV